MKINKDITVIIPVHDPKGDALKRSMLSIQTQMVKPKEVLLITPTKYLKTTKSILSEFKEEHKGLKYTIVENSGVSELSEQLNLGASKVTTKWFLYLEQDDELSNVIISNYTKYSNNSEINNKMLFNINLISKEDGTTMDLTNQPVWALEFSDTFGEVDTEVLLNYQNFNISGALIDKDSYIECGGLKSNIKVSFIYEFLLRFTNTIGNIYVVPKIGCRHYAMTEGSYSSIIANEVSKSDIMWWFNTAKKEYFHKRDRVVEFDGGER
jgi:hypothetical protein